MFGLGCLAFGLRLRPRRISGLFPRSQNLLPMIQPLLEAFFFTVGLRVAFFQAVNLDV